MFSPFAFGLQEDPRQARRSRVCLVLLGVPTTLAWAVAGLVPAVSGSAALVMTAMMLWTFLTEAEDEDRAQARSRGVD